MKGVWRPLVFLLFLHDCLSLKCNSKDNCFCVPGAKEFEFQCSLNSNISDEILLVHIIEGRLIHIDCPPSLETFNFSLLPNVIVEEIDKLWMRSCPLPPNNFKEVLDHFGVQKVKGLHISSSNFSNVTLTKSYFEGLESLEYVELIGNDLVEMEDDVFEYFPNLRFLELQGNKLVLKNTFFRYSPLLQGLDISENHLETIPEGFFQHLQRLELLYLWGNNFKSIENTTFHGAPSLKSLELSSNQIERIAEDVFKTLTNLTRLNLSSNKLRGVLPETLLSNNKMLQMVAMNNNPKLSLPDKFFSNLPVLAMVELRNCEIEDLPENIFSNSSRMKNLTLKNNLLRELPDGVFRDLRKFEKLFLQNNKIEKIGKAFANLRELKVLDLGYNQIREITNENFKDLTKLETLYLQNNQIGTIQDLAFNSNQELKEIDLSRNQYTISDSYTFSLLQNQVKVMYVNLSHNRIDQIVGVVEMVNKIHLEFLDLSYNDITGFRLTDLTPLSSKLTVYLQHNNITTVDFDYVNDVTENVEQAYSTNKQSQSIIHLTDNPLDCSCSNYDLLRYTKDKLDWRVRGMFDIKTDEVQCASPPELQHFLLEELPLQLVVCDFNNSCPENSSCFWRPYDHTLILDFSAKNLTRFPQLDIAGIKPGFKESKAIEKIEVNLEGNQLRGGFNRSLRGYENVSVLNLCDNQIEEVGWVPPRLEVLKLDHNRIKNFKYEVLRKLNSSSLVTLTLEGNPWSCDCDAENLTTFIRQHPKMVENASRIFCVNSTHRLRDLNKNDLCQTFGLSGVAIGILMVLLLVAIITIMYFKYQQPLKVWLYAHNLCLWWVTEEELDKDKIYDAFISYSHLDEDFVVQNLVPVLEGGTNPYKLCLHFRDFIPGEYILTQVTNTVIDSRRTLVVLSPNFLESVWGKAEFRTAHTQAMTEGRARVIIVLYGDIDVENVDDELKAYMKTNTYVKWGDPYFWRKLRYALPHSKRNVSNNQKIANVMNCIDDRFNLVAPVTAPGSTPPLLFTDPQGLKNHPLNFVARGMDTPPAESGTLLVGQ